MNSVRILTALLFAAAPLFAPTARAADAWPTKPLRFVVPVVPGGAIDAVSRVVAERLTAALGQQVIVDNRPGAGGSIGLEAVAKANPDGYTLATVTNLITILPSMYRKLAFDPQTSFAPIILMTTQPLVLAVHPSLPAANFKEFVALSKAKPGTVSFGSGSIHDQLTGELIKQRGGINMTHVPYKGGGQAIVDLIGGQIQAGVLGSSPVIPQARANKVRVLAVTTRARSPALPNVPTLAESGVSGFDVYQWIALLAPARTPKEIVARLNAEVTKILMQPAVRERLEAAGFEPKAGSAKEVEVLIRDEQAVWSKLIKELGLKLD